MLEAYKTKPNKTRHPTETFKNPKTKTNEIYCFPDLSNERSEMGGPHERRGRVLARREIREGNLKL